MTKIFEQFDSATATIGAYAILDATGEYVARVVFKFPRDGAGRLYCYFQLWGAPMVRGFAGGYGYDKQSAAFDSAARNWKADDAWNPEKASAIHRAIVEARETVGGERWSNTLERLGYRVLSVTG